MTTKPQPALTRTLLDRTGRLWRWNSTLPRRPGEEPSVFCHGGYRRTERELEDEAEPIIEVCDQRVLAVHLEPVPASQIRLNDLVVLPDHGELSPVIGIWPCTDRYARLVYVCTDNGDWAHRSADSLLLRADIRSPARHGPPAVRRTSTQQVPGLEVLAPQCFQGQVKEDPSTHNERITMSATLTADAAPTTVPAADDPFTLDVQIITDVPAGHPLSACGGGTDDGCDPTCASACVTGGV